MIPAACMYIVASSYCSQGLYRWLQCMVVVYLKFSTKSTNMLYKYFYKKLYSVYTISKGVYGLWLIFLSG